MASIDLPRRGELWLVALGAGRAGEPGKYRPAIVLSVDDLISGSDSDLLVVIPVSASREPSALRPTILEHEGVSRPSVAVVRAVRAIAITRCVSRLGTLDASTLRSVEVAIRSVLGLTPTGGAQAS